ncbi:helix-turn-helix transcriptional regulator [Flavobacterium sp. GSB-24]|uniref:AraC family transcriptional regulator n=1 Tax=Flavobacterium sp. GSB-24 TaxID=2994319 RepID=UPI00249394B3|nr:helix-turn-helix transcriptional regulator [Flavobacterium sp. GSB-24]BDU25175.1 hypothetical protein FLGSB24_19190 [Flavobacterium sp. GSB-24]
MGNKTDKFWLTQLKAAYLKDITSVKAGNALFVPGWLSLVFVVAGTIRFKEGSCTVELSAGDLFLVPSAAKLDAVPSPAQICLLCCAIEFVNNIRIVKFGFGYAKAIPYQDAFVLSLMLAEGGYMISLFEILTRNISNKDAVFQDELILLCVSMILYEYIELRFKYDKNTQKVPYSEKIVRSFIKQVQNNCVAHHDVKFYADALFVSKGHLGKLVRSNLGISAKYFIELAIISESYLLLEDDGLSITDIAEKLHFDSCSSFSGFFKKHTKLTPTQYRRSLKF